MVVLTGQFVRSEGVVNAFRVLLSVYMTEVA